MATTQLPAPTPFDEAMARLEAVEGGYSNDPADPGGETNHGITLRVARAFGYQGAMRELSRAQAADIYRARYWTPQMLDVIAIVSRPIALELFDTGVNMGTAVAGRFLQRALNVLNNGGMLYPESDVDGRIGRLTVAALREFVGRRGKEGERVMLVALNCQQGARYIEIAEAQPTSEKFVYGWLRTRIEGVDA